MVGNNITKIKNKKKWIIPLLIVGGLFLIFIFLFLFSTFNTQMVVGLVQKSIYGSKPINTYDPFFEPHNELRDNGQYIISEINYDEEYPNSYLDIIYPSDELTKDRPTLLFIHGGGFYEGSKNDSDPLTPTDKTALIDDICASGFNIVNVDYALVPDYHFPTPIIQINRAIDFLNNHKDEYHLNMNKVIIMGQSAGGTIASQLGSLISNPNYAQLLGISPSIESSKIKAIVIDDAPLDFRAANLKTTYFIGNYIKGSVYLNDDELSKYNIILQIDENYPYSIVLAAEYRDDMLKLSNALENKNVEHLLIDPLLDTKEIQPHCFISFERTNEYAKQAFDNMINVLKQKCSD